MLVLTRQPNTHIVIEVPGRDKPIIITVVESKGSRGGRVVRLGVSAEEDINIYRSELHPDRYREEFAGILTVENAEDHSCQLTAPGYRTGSTPSETVDSESP